MGGTKTTVRMVSSAAAMTLVLAGCASKSVETKNVGDENTNGIAYSLPRALVQISASWDGGAKQKLPVVEVGTVLVADPNTSYVIQADHSIWANDEIVLETKNGLLTTVNATTEDQTGAALKKAVEIAAEIAKLAALSDGAAPSAQKKAFSVTIQFDPFDSKARARAEQALAAVGLSVKMGDFSGSSLSAVSEPTDCTHSLCYRVPVSILVAVEGGAASSFSGLSKSFRAEIPDTRKLYGYNVKRAACVKSVTKLTLTDGVLSKVDINKPSEVVGCLNIPLDVLKAIVAVPGELLKFETTNLENEKKLLDAERALIEARGALLEAQTPPPEVEQ